MGSIQEEVDAAINGSRHLQNDLLAIESAPQPLTLPKYVIVGPMTYEVVVDEREIQHHQVESDEVIFGYTNFYTQKIYISPTVPVRRQLLVLIHECLHAMLNLGQAFSFRKPVSEEKIVTHLEDLFFTFIIDNPRLVDTIRRCRGEAALL